MRFAVDTEIREFAASVAAQLTKADTPAVIRAWAAGDSAPGVALWERLAETGVAALALPEELDGMGAGAVEVVVALETLGRHAVPGPVVESVAVAPTLLGGFADAELAAGIAGELAAGAFVTVACPPAAPYAADVPVASHVLLAADAGVYAGEVAGEHRPTVDRARTLTALTPGARLGDADVDAVLDHGALGTAAYALGLAQGMLTMGVDYAGQRSQFGRLIGSFQAVKHQLADVAIAIEMARPLLWAGALATDEATAARSRDVSAAAVACKDAAHLAYRTALQVHGGIGYTMEHDLGLWLTAARERLTAWGAPTVHRGRVLAAIAPEEE